MSDLFTPISRTERQKQAERAWIKAKGIGTIVAPTGLGKTRIGTDIIQAFVVKRPTLRVIVVVPTQTLQEQWISILNSLGLSLNTEVLVINTASRYNYQCDLLIVDKNLST